MKLPFPPLTLDTCAWALRPEVLPRVLAASRLAIDPAKLLAGRDKEIAARSSVTRVPFAGPANGDAAAGPVIAVIPLTGILTPHGSLMSLLFGYGTGGLQGFRDQLAEAVASPEIGAIVIDVDSPGGQTALTPETAADVAAARSVKPVVAVANTQACSAAYWIASQADELAVTPSGFVGSIGTYMHHEDWSGFETELGVAHTFIVSDDSPYKVDGNMFFPLSDHAKESWQEEVDTIQATFVADVAAARGVSEDTVRSDFGQGDILLAEDAVNAGMADRVATLEQVISDLITINAPGGSSASALATRIRAKVQHAKAERPEDDTSGGDPELDPDDVEAVEFA